MAMIVGPGGESAAFGPGGNSAAEGTIVTSMG
jgi:hypothetical protein